MHILPSRQNWINIATAWCKVLFNNEYQFFSASNQKRNVETIFFFTDDYTLTMVGCDVCADFVSIISWSLGKRQFVFQTEVAARRGCPTFSEKHFKL